MKIFKGIITAAVSAPMLTVTAFAADYNKEADNLNKLGLFLGTENGYELERTMTRAEGATMLVRLLGKEQEALKISPKGTFGDVPVDEWYAPYVEYCADGGVTKGTGNGNYSPDDTLRGDEYMTLVMRALGYKNAEPENVDLVAAEYSLTSSLKAKELASIAQLDRDRMVYISYQALSVKNPNGKKLVEKLIEDKAIDKTIAEKQGLLAVEKADF